MPKAVVEKKIINNLCHSVQKHEKEEEEETERQFQSSLRYAQPEQEVEEDDEEKIKIKKKRFLESCFMTNIFLQCFITTRILASLGELDQQQQLTRGTLSK